MKWEKITIGKHCTVTSSKRFHLSDRSNEGIPFYCSKEIIKKVEGEIILECDYIKEEAYEEIKKKYGVPKCGDLLITTRGSYGVPYIYRADDKFYFADGNLTWLKDFDEQLYSKFLYYWILSYEGQKKIDAIAKGTAQKAVPILSIKNLEIYVPSINKQRKIVDILSTYDELIENNQKQIKLLEEAAQRLYKEWFVDLRFPGYENTPIIDGVPEGWNINRADFFYDITIGKTPSRNDKQCFVKQNIGVPWVSISDMGNINSYVLNTAENLTREAVKKYNVKVVPPGTILLSFKLTVGKVAITSTEMCTNEAIAHFYINYDYQRTYTYFYLKNFKYNILGNTSAISKAVNSQIIKAMPVIMPKQEVIKEFSGYVTPILEQIKNKQILCLKLTEARDRLLTKLMSGEIEV